MPAAAAGWDLDKAKAGPKDSLSPGMRDMLITYGELVQVLPCPHILPCLLLPRVFRRRGGRYNSGSTPNHAAHPLPLPAEQLALRRLAPARQQCPAPTHRKPAPSQAAYDNLVWDLCSPRYGNTKDPAEEAATHLLDYLTYDYSLAPTRFMAGLDASPTDKQGTKDK